ncbi:hypothetical protein QFC22_000004 [Naganishia vaughanmartiniae]|uniref:Uncharacterized protein n=1 Tax=Naganishia vaughanmartiniae TaxID=1424756 RepID=A0ACC2XPT8_9TREE|nr:hypothetical protein QFC22_000004 [Naganishia vaughanmartiniae]
MAQHRHPYQLHPSHYQQLQPQYGVTAQGGTSGAGYAQQVWQQQGYHGIGVVTGQSGVSEGGQNDEMNNYHRMEFAASTLQRSSTVPLTSRRTLVPVPPATANLTTNSTTDDALQSLLTSRPSLLPLPKLAAPAGSNTSATSRATSRIAVLANVREQAVGQFIAMELKREKERKRKAEYRARKRAEEIGGDGDEEEEGMRADEEDMEDVIGLEGTEAQQSNGGRKASAEDSMSERRNQTRHSHETTPPITFQPQQYHHQQQNVIDPVLVGQGDSAYGSRLGAGGGEKVQVRVGDRIVAIKLGEDEEIHWQERLADLASVTVSTSPKGEAKLRIGFQDMNKMEATA